MSYGVVCRNGLNPVLLWLWRRLAVIALIVPLAWEPPYTTGAALKRQKRQKNKKTNKQKKDPVLVPTVAQVANVVHV